MARRASRQVKRELFAVVFVMSLAGPFGLIGILLLIAFLVLWFFLVVVLLLAVVIIKVVLLEPHALHGGRPRGVDPAHRALDRLPRRGELHGDDASAQRSSTSVAGCVELKPLHDRSVVAAPFAASVVATLGSGNCVGNNGHMGSPETKHMLN